MCADNRINVDIFPFEIYSVISFFYVSRLPYQKTF